MHVIEGPDGATPEQVMAAAQANIPQAAAAAPSLMDRLATAGKQVIAGAQDPVGKNAVLGAVRGAAGIGATIMQPFQALADKLGGTSGSNQETRAGIDNGLQSLGADTNSLGFKNGKLATEIAGTAGVGGALGAGARVLGAAPKVVNALSSAGFTTGEAVAPNALAKIGDVALRSGAGAATGAATTGLIDPNTAGTGAMVGAALPPGLKALGAVAEPVGAALATGAKSTAERLMQSALKPTIAQLRSGEAKTAVQTLLDYGINPTANGVNKLQDLISGLNSDITAKIQGSSATVSKQNVVNALADVKSKFGNQVSPTGDLAAIGGVQDDFLAHPLTTGDNIPVAQAQQMKQGTYKVLAGKYGQVGSAETEAQKGLARGLKDEIAAAVPGVGEMNAEESRLLATLSVTERRALMDANKNPMGLAMLAHNPLSWMAFMADKSAAFKSLAARAINSAAPAAGNVNALAAPALYRAAPRSIQNGTQP